MVDEVIFAANKCENALALLNLVKQAYTASVKKGEAYRKARVAEQIAAKAEQKKADNHELLRAQARILWYLYHIASDITNLATTSTTIGGFEIGSPIQPFKETEFYKTTTPFNLAFHIKRADDCMTVALNEAETAEINVLIDHGKFRDSDSALKNVFEVKPYNKANFDAIVTNASVCGKNHEWSKKVSTAAKIAVEAAKEYKTYL